MSKETTQEASAIHAKQLQYDRQIADLNLTISKLQSSLREAQKDPSSQVGGEESSKQSDEDFAKKIKILSEEILRLRDNEANHKSEVLTMKSRLKAAVDRAAKAEEQLAAAHNNANGSEDYDSMERGPAGKSLSRRRRRAGSPSSGSIRSVMRLNPGQGEGREQIGMVVDAVDSFAVSTGKSCS